MDLSSESDAASKAHQMSSHSWKAVTEEGYDSIAQRYLDWTTSTPSPRVLWLQKLLSQLPSDSSVLELGCGAGVPCTQLLVEHCKGSVTGVDVSAAQLELARKHVPGARLVKSDMMLVFDEKTLDAVVGFYSLIHLPREEQVVLMKRIRGWLKDGGWLLINLALGNEEEIVAKDWLGGGKSMFWSAWDETGNIEMIEGAGFDIVEKMIISDMEDGREVKFMWVLGRNKASTLK